MHTLTLAHSLIKSRVLVLRGAKWVREEETQQQTGQIQFLHDQWLRSRTLMKFSQGQLIELFSSLQCPVLLILAEKGISLVWAEGKANKDMFARKAAIKDIKEVFVPGEGHHVHLEAPEKIQRPLKVYLSLRLIFYFFLIIYLFSTIGIFGKSVSTFKRQ